MQPPPKLSDIIEKGQRIETHRPWPRAVVDHDVWMDAIGLLRNGHWALSGFWADSDSVHMALLDEKAAEMSVISLPCPDGWFPSVAQSLPRAIRLERAIHDLFGLRAEGAPDPRPWLDHGRWGARHPLGRTKPEATERGATRDEALETPYPFLPSIGESLHQIAVGPVHAGIIEPGHFRFTANGETVVRLEQRLGYAHKGVEALMAGAELERAAKLAGRISGDSTVAYAIAFARAVEAALEVEIPERAHYLRALMAELERLANHFGDIGAICNDASFTLMHAHCGILRERVLRAADSCFGHRLMQDIVVPGGVSKDFDGPCAGRLKELVNNVRLHFPALVGLFDDAASLKERTVGTGVLSPALARKYGCGGFVGRASGRNFDARRNLAYPPYPALRFDVPVLNSGDVNARVWIRISEVEQSLSLIEQILAALPGGSIHTVVPRHSGEGLSLVEGFRGDVLAWVRLDDFGKISRCHMRDPSWFQWPLLEAVIEGNIVADFPLCNKSFNCSYSGHDL